MLRAAFRPSALGALILVACSGDATSRPAPQTPAPPVVSTEASADEPVPAGRLPADVRPQRYDLVLTVDPALETFQGTASIDVELPRTQRSIFLHAEGLQVAEVTVTPADGEAQEATFAMADEARHVAAIRTAAPVGPGRVRLTLHYQAPFDRNLEGLYRVTQAGEPYAFTQMEPLGARKAFPCFDEPSFKTPFHVTLIVRDGHAAIANGPEAATEPAGEGLRRVRFAPTEPLPTYLVAFAVGPFDVVEAPVMPINDVRDRPVALRGVAPRGQGARLAYALEHTPRILASLERYFGIPYPYAKLDLIAVPDFGAGAMENAGAITFRDGLLLLHEDAPIRQRRGFAYVTAHELAHQWFGNLVTMAWWDDLWLNEAFATWAETRTIGETFPEHRPDLAEMGVVLDAMDSDSLAAARQIRQPIESDHDIHNAFDRITYSKGNGVLAMFERWLGVEVFRRGVQRYLRERPHGNATADDFLAALSAEAGRDVSGPFRSFLEQPGLPLIGVTPSCAEGRGRLALSQARYLPLGSAAEAARTWQVPLCVRYAVDGQVHRECTLVTEATSELALSRPGCPSWVMPNAEGVGYYRFTLPPEALSALRQSGAALTVRERLALADSVRASFEAGRTSFADALAALSPLAQSGERSLARMPMSLYELAIDRLLEPAEVGRARRSAARLYAADARRLGFAARPPQDPETQLWRVDLLNFLADTVEDPAVRREAARRGRAHLGLGGDGELHPEAVPSDLAELSVRVALQEGGAPAFEHALALLARTTDPAARGRLVSGLASVRDPALRTRALALMLDERLRQNETFRPLMAQTRDPEGVESAWAWLVEHYDAVAARLGPGYAAYLPYAATGFCTTERAEQARAFFEPRVAATQGGPRNLAAATETVRLCAARAAHAQGSARSTFAR